VPVVDAAILDGAAVVQMLNPGTSKTFQEYADAVFVSYISARKSMQHTGEKSSALLKSLIWLTLHRVHRLTLVFFYTWQMLYRRGARRWSYALLILMWL